MIVPFKETENSERCLSEGKVSYSLIWYMCPNLGHSSVHLILPTEI